MIAMKRMMLTLLACAVGTGLVSAQADKNAPPAAGKVLYENDFQNTEPGPVPDDMMVLDGGFAVKEIDGNRCLELPGSPLETYGVLFGPTETAGVAVTARVFGTGKGRRYPVFSVGLNGVAGFKLRISQAKQTMELLKGDEILTAVPYRWKSGAWTLLHLQVRNPKEGEWVVEGKAWTAGTEEPAAWQISHTATNEPPAGRGAIWGSPFAGTPIRYDDLRMVSLK